MRRSSGMSPAVALLIVIAIVGALLYFVWHLFGNGPVGDAFCGAIQICEQIGLR
ncbi:hypothetical protein IJJ08_01515 [bacterium]|nr:hypothetical protein [bacterium]